MAILCWQSGVFWSGASILGNTGEHCLPRVKDAAVNFFGCDYGEIAGNPGGLAGALVSFASIAPAHVTPEAVSQRASAPLANPVLTCALSQAYSMGTLFRDTVHRLRQCTPHDQPYGFFFYSQKFDVLGHDVIITIYMGTKPLNKGSIRPFKDGTYAVATLRITPGFAASPDGEGRLLTIEEAVCLSVESVPATEYNSPEMRYILSRKSVLRPMCFTHQLDLFAPAGGRRRGPRSTPVKRPAPDKSQTVVAIAETPTPKRRRFSMATPTTAPLDASPASGPSPTSSTIAALSPMAPGDLFANFGAPTRATAAQPELFQQALTKVREAEIAAETAKVELQKLADELAAAKKVAADADRRAAQAEAKLAEYEHAAAVRANDAEETLEASDLLRPELNIGDLDPDGDFFNGLFHDDGDFLDHGIVGGN